VCAPVGTSSAGVVRECLRHHYHGGCCQLATTASGWRQIDFSCRPAIPPRSADSVGRFDSALGSPAAPRALTSDSQSAPSAAGDRQRLGETQRRPAASDLAFLASTRSANVNSCDCWLCVCKCASAGSMYAGLDGPKNDCGVSSARNRNCMFSAQPVR
jgi:hypothetical protein